MCCLVNEASFMDLLVCDMMGDNCHGGRIDVLLCLNVDIETCSIHGPKAT